MNAGRVSLGLVLAALTLAGDAPAQPLKLLQQQAERLRQTNRRSQPPTKAKAVPEPPASVPAVPDSSTDAQVLEAWSNRALDLRKALRRLDPKLPEPPARLEEPALLVETPVYGMTYEQSGQARFLVLRLVLVNPTDEKLAITPEQVSATVDGNAKSLQAPSWRGASQVQYENQSYSTSKMQPFKTWEAPPKSVTSKWLSFGLLPMSPDVPKVALSVEVGGKPVPVDVNQQQRAVLNLRSEVTGPRNALAVATIDGKLNTFNLQSVAEEFERLAAAKVTRLVLEWGANAPRPEQQTVHWVQYLARSVGNSRNNVNEMFPSLPASFEEFHFAQVPGTARSFGGDDGQTFWHETTAQAVTAALLSAYDAVPVEDVLKDLRQGSELIRTAALLGGGRRLPVDTLPEVVRLTRGEPSDLQRAAVVTLGEFGEPAALSRLLELARADEDPLFPVVIDTLAGSRFQAHRDALRELIGVAEPARKEKIVDVLARSPQAEWSGLLFEFARRPDGSIREEVLKGLVRIGHPQLRSLLEMALASTDGSVRDFAFQTLAERPDAESEAIARDYALRRLEAGDFDGNVTQFLTRTREPAAVPLLWKRIEQADGRREDPQAVRLYCQLTDQEGVEKLAGRFGRLKRGEQTLLLHTLREVHSPRLYEIARGAVLGSDQTLANHAVQTLIQDGAPESSAVLLEALRVQKNAQVLQQVIAGMGQIFTRETRPALLEFRAQADSTELKQAATLALEGLKSRSPAYQYVRQAQQHLTEGKRKEAEQMIDLAVQLDPELPDAWRMRGNLALQDGKSEAAMDAFRKALDVEPGERSSTEGVAIIHATAGRIAEAERLIEGLREQYKDNNEYQYNSACVYGRAHEWAEKQADLADREARLKEYRGKALERLRAAVEKGYNDADWAMKDPDLKSLSGDEEFRTIVKKIDASESNP